MRAGGAAAKPAETGFLVGGSSTQPPEAKHALCKARCEKILCETQAFFVARPQGLQALAAPFFFQGLRIDSPVNG